MGDDLNRDSGLTDSGKRHTFFSFEKVYILITILMFSAIAGHRYLDPMTTTPGTGTGLSNPWKTVDSVNAHNFGANDTIYIARGTTSTTTATSVKRISVKDFGFWGVLSPGGSGLSSGRAVIDAYDAGHGSALPVIDAKGQALASGIMLYNQQYWTIRNIAVRNMVPGPVVSSADSAAAQSFRCGILVYSDNNNATLSNITIENDSVTDIYGYYQNLGPWDRDRHHPGGIIVHDNHNTVVTKSFDNILIRNNTVQNILGTGILFSSNISALNDEWSTRVHICKNFVKSTSCDGIRTEGGQDVWIDSNYVSKVGELAKLPDGPVAGIYPSNPSLGGIIEYNWVDSTIEIKGADGTAFDDEGQHGTVYFQYNVSKDNYGGFFMDNTITRKASADAQITVRFNLSVNDGHNTEEKGKVFQLNGSHANFYNNIVYTDGNIYVYEGENNNFINNLFYCQRFIDGSAPKDETQSKNNYLHNWFYAPLGVYTGFDRPWNDPPKSIYELYPGSKYGDPDPMLVGTVGSGGKGFTDIPRDFRLTTGSISKLSPFAYVYDKGVHDYFGYPLNDYLIPGFDQDNSKDAIAGIKFIKSIARSHIRAKRIDSVGVRK